MCRDANSVRYSEPAERFVITSVNPERTSAIRVSKKFEKCCAQSLPSLRGSLSDRGNLLHAIGLGLRSYHVIHRDGPIRTLAAFGFLILVMLANTAAAQETMPEFREPSGPLTLQHAIDSALLGNPNLAAFSWDVRIADARIAQSRLRPNPELSVEVEGIRLGGKNGATQHTQSLGLSSAGAPTGSLEWERESGGGVFDESEITLRLSQLIELGGKRAARIAAARAAREVASWDYEIVRYHVLGDVVTGFAEVLAAQEGVRRAGQLVSFTEKLAQTVSARVEAGSASPLERRRINAEAEQYRIEETRERGVLAQSRLRLAATWGSAAPIFAEAAGDLSELPALPSLEVLLARRTATPLLRRWTAELARRETVLAQERKRHIPDLTLALGYRAESVDEGGSRGLGIGTDGVGFSRTSARLDDDWEHSMVLEASIPLPLFNRNQGTIREAEFMVLKASDERRATEAVLASELTRHYLAAQTAIERAEALESRVLPELDTTYALTHEGYERGKFDLLTVLDAERSVTQARFDATDSRIAYHLALAQIERIVGAAVLPDERKHPAPSSETVTAPSDKE